MIIQENMTPQHDLLDAWQLLHHDDPRLYEQATFNYRGKLQRGLTIEAEVMRENVPVTVRFQVRDKGRIRYEKAQVVNLWNWESVYNYSFTRDTRLLPYELYQQEESRSYHAHTLLDFRWKSTSDIRDTLGSDGGVNSQRMVLATRQFPPPTIDATGWTKIHGAARGPLDSGSSETDSDEDEEGQDEHKMAQIRHACHLGQPVAVILKGQYEFQHEPNKWRLEKVRFQQYFQPRTEPEHILQPLQEAFSSIEERARYYGVDRMPRSCSREEVNTPRESIEITVKKHGKGVRINYASNDCFLCKRYQVDLCHVSN
jgi:hypothetical protein